MSGADHKQGWRVSVLTLFPEMFPGPLGLSLSGKALAAGKWRCAAVNIRDFAEDVHKTVDDTPYGGGAGMVMRPDIIEKALLSVPEPGRKIYLSPRGRRLTQALVAELAAAPALTLLCGRYEGVDQRVLDACGFEEVSIGDYVLSGGEPAALILMDACIRLLPGVMGNAETAGEESFSPGTGGLLEYPHYTRPQSWTDAQGRAHEVPEILRSGDHARIARWRREQAERITRERRPDLLGNAAESGEKSL
jgi:tRNA (guanine37-N1)-methyltransferase